MKSAPFQGKPNISRDSRSVFLHLKTLVTNFKSFNQTASSQHPLVSRGTNRTLIIRVPGAKLNYFLRFDRRLRLEKRKKAD